jgi:hypothetical protein
MKKILGRTDIIDFPKLKLYNVNVKIDTGAYTSAIHCSSILERDGKLHCIFDPMNDKSHTEQSIVFNNYSLTDVKSSNGHRENRFKIKTEVIFFGKQYNINLTLSTRDDMKYPVLIGRQFLSKKFLVDVDLVNQSFNHSINEYSNSLT